MYINASLGHILEVNRYRLADALHTFALQLAPQPGTAQSYEALAELDLELPNIIDLFDTVLDSDFVGNPGCIEHLTLVSLLLQLERYLTTRGLWDEKLRWALRLLIHGKKVGRTPDVPLFNVIGSAYADLGEHEEAISWYQYVIEAHDGDDSDLARIYGNLGVAYWSLGRLDDALVALQRVLEVEQSRGITIEGATAIANIAQIFFDYGQPLAALEASLQALGMAQQLGDVVLEARFTAMVAGHAMGCDFPEQAAELFERGLALLTEINDEVGLALTRMNYAILSIHRGERERAMVLIAESARTFERLHMPELAEARALREKIASS